MTPRRPSLSALLPRACVQTPVAPDGTPATIEGIARRYRTLCNDTMRLWQESPVWTPGTGDSFEMNLRLRVRLQPLFVQPNLDEVVKQGFVQCATLLFCLSKRLPFVVLAFVALAAALMATALRVPLGLGDDRGRLVAAK